MPDNNRMDGLQLLASDHRTVEDLFERYEKAEGASAKQKLVQQPPRRFLDGIRKDWGQGFGIVQRLQILG